MDNSPLEALFTSWMRSLRARNLSEATRSTYAAAAAQLITHLGTRGVRHSAGVKRADLEEWIGELVVTRSPATASNRYRAIQQWFKWMLDEDEIDENPMDRMRPPMVPEHPVEVLSLEQIKPLLKVCDGRDFMSRRDTAIIRLFVDTGMRLSELAGLTVDNIDLDQDVAVVLGKGRRTRACPFGAKTAQALDRYLRARSAQKGSKATGLWLNEKGRGVMLSNGVAQMVRRRGREAGIEGLHPHQLRHSAVHEWLAEGGSEGDAMRLFGWKSRQMLSRYAASTADQRAREAHRRLGLGDKI